MMACSCLKNKVGNTYGCVLAFTQTYCHQSPSALPKLPDHNSSNRYKARCQLTTDHLSLPLKISDPLHELYANHSFAGFFTAGLYLGCFSNSQS